MLSVGNLKVQKGIKQIEISLDLWLLNILSHFKVIFKEFFKVFMTASHILLWAYYHAAYTCSLSF